MTGRQLTLVGMEVIKLVARKTSRMATETDASLGGGVLLGALSVAGALGMYVAQSQANTAYAFAAAVTLGVLAVGAFHVYD